MQFVQLIYYLVRTLTYFPQLKSLVKDIWNGIYMCFAADDDVTTCTTDRSVHSMHTKKLKKEKKIFKKNDEPSKLGKLGKLWIVIDCAPRSIDVWFHLPLTQGYTIVESDYLFIGEKCLFKGPIDDLEKCYNQCRDYLRQQHTIGFTYYIRHFYIAKDVYPKKLHKLNGLFAKCEKTLN
jgi:hypothetical protein